MEYNFFFPMSVNTARGLTPSTRLTDDNDEDDTDDDDESLAAIDGRNTEGGDPPPPQTCEDGEKLIPERCVHRCLRKLRNCLSGGDPWGDKCEKPIEADNWLTCILKHKCCLR